MDRETSTDRYGMRAEWGFDNTPALNDLHADAMESDRRCFRFGPGEYQFLTPPQPIQVRGIELHAHRRNATILSRRFKTKHDHIGLLNFNETAWGTKVAGFMFVSRKECGGTGSMVSLVTQPAPEGVAGFSIEYCRFTSTAPGGAVKYHLHMDGSNGGEAETPRIRGFELLHNEFFGHVAGGACVNLCSVSGGYILGGWCTPGTDPEGAVYPAAVLRFDGGRGTYADTQNLSGNMTGNHTIEFIKAKNILFDCPVIADLRRRPPSYNIDVRSPHVSAQSGGWSGEDNCWLRS